ncbi:hypothetical protein NPA31_010605 [Aurantimonas sp. MSK8Z-1]|uniref:hypothetical protein n=1 Tax=Mangrovibrevibacter kandeliae TaxID=2968473 RepID=UPI00211903EF|nr:hypothetical protein [Aurantimonas sp. MSK8Z-1]MCW4115409.1 hypothetical protein [Aurantimonas sp. MSK8Z-1]
MFQTLKPTALVLGMIATGLLTGLPSLAFAQAAKGEPVRVRGAIVALQGDSLQVKTREGETVDLALADGWTVSGVASATLGDIKPGDFVGIASLPKADGGDGALEVLVFPPAMKGTGEGSYGWDLKPNSTMTNATVADAVKDVNGRTVTVSFHGKEKKIAVPDGTPVVTIAPATKDDLKPGARVFVTAAKAADGKLSAQRVVVGNNGVVPPM